MKKLLLLGVIATGLNCATSEARAGGISFSISLGHHHRAACPPPVYVAPAPVYAPPVVVRRPVVCAPVYRGHGHWVEHRHGFYGRGPHFGPRAYAAQCEPRHFKPGCR